MSPQPSIDVTDLTVCYGSHEALRSVTFAVPPGSFLTVVGPNGSGKSTLMKALLGLVPATEGRVRVLGRPPGQGRPGAVGYVPQVKTQDRSFPAQALEVVLTALRHRWPGRVSAEDRRRATAALEAAGAGALATRALSDLSGGEMQRVYLARSFVRTPELLLLDEPATGVDAVGTADLMEVLGRYQRAHQATVVMVTHDWNVAYHHASHALLLDRRVVGFGPPSQALSSEHMRVAFGHVGHAHAMVREGEVKDAAHPPHDAHGSGREEQP